MTSNVLSARHFSSPMHRSELNVTLFYFILFCKVFLLESQLKEEFDRGEDEFPTNEDEDHRTFFFVISSNDVQESAENTTR